MHRYLCLLILTSLTLAACESEVLTSNPTVEHKLLLNPERLEGEQYKVYKLRAKITNIPVSDLIFEWDFDQGTGYPSLGWTASAMFTQVRVYQVRVKVYDGFTDSLLAYDSIRVDIRPPAAVMELTPATVDTVTVSDANGNTNIYVPFVVETSTPSNFVRTVWKFGDGSAEEVIYGTAANHTYKAPGMYMVVVSAYNNENAFLGSDTSHVKVRVLAPTMEDIAQAKSISAFMVIDSSHPVAQDPMFANPFAMTVPSVTQNPADTLDKVTFTTAGRNIHATYQYKSRSTTQYPKFKNDTISCTFSEDLQRVESATIIANDSGYLLYPGSNLSGSQRYRYVLKDLELVSANSLTAVYRSRSIWHADFLTDLDFAATFKAHPTGSFIPSSPITLPPGAFAMIKIDR